MPRAPKHCGHYPCRNKVRGRTYCPDHTPAAWEGSERSKDTSTAAWRKLRLAVLERDDHVCQLRLNVCIGEATQADHTQPKSTFNIPAMADTMVNLRALCKPCHAQHSARQGGLASGEVRRSAAYHPH